MIKFYLPVLFTFTLANSLSNFDYRLPKTLEPINYQIHLKINLPSDSLSLQHEENILGNLSILMKCNYDTNFITLHSKRIRIFRNSITLYEVSDESGGPETRIDVDQDNVEESEEFEQVRISALSTLKSGKMYKVFINYATKLNRRPIGFYWNEYRENNVTKFLAVTHFQPTYARYALPCFDEPEFKATFVVSLTHPKHTKALSNGMEKNYEQIDDLYGRTDFQSSPKMSSYLLAFALVDYDSVSTVTKNNVTIRIWCRPSMINYTSYALEIAPKILDYFESIFNTPFPLEKIDIVALQDYTFAAMENYGLIPFKELELLVDKNSSPYFLIRRTTEVLSHEFAHQWFGNLVTMKWWDNIWINEAFCVFMQYYGASHVMGKNYNLEENFMLKSFAYAFDIDSLPSVRPLQQPVRTPREIVEMFDKVTYDKGASLVRMLRNVLGEDIFENVTQKYFRTFAYRNVDALDLFRFFTKEISKLETFTDWNNKPLNITTLMMPWITQNGFPIVELHRNVLDQTVTFSQTRYSFSSNVTSANKWHIPVRYLIQGLQAKQVWLTPEQNVTLSDVVSSDEWILLNYENFGYFRTNYDYDTWKLLTSLLQNEHEKIPSMSRARLIDDAFSLARIGKVDYEVAFNLIDYLPNEKSLFVWSIVLGHLNWINTRLMNTNHKSFINTYYSKMIQSLKTRMRDLKRMEHIDKSAIEFMNTIILHIACDFAVLPECNVIKRMWKKIFHYVRVNCSVSKLSSTCNQ